MPDNDEAQITLVTLEEEGYQSRSKGTLEYVTEPLKVSVLRDRFREFMAGLQAMIELKEVAEAPFQLEEIQFSAEISANGEFKLLGTGMGMEASSAVTFVLKRKGK